jgi:ribonuclease P protein component
MKSGGDFVRARAEGRRVVQGCLIVNWLATPRQTESRLGVITSRKVGHAVIRSRSRRLLREAFRQHQHQLKQPVDLVLVARPSIAGKSMRTVDRDYLAALQRCGLLPPTGLSAPPDKAPALPAASPGGSSRSDSGSSSSPHS